MELSDKILRMGHSILLIRTGYSRVILLVRKLASVSHAKTEPLFHPRALAHRLNPNMPWLLLLGQGNQEHGVAVL